MSSDESNPPSTSASSQSSGTPTYTMATAINLPTFREFELQPRDTAPTRFEKYVKRLNNMFTAMGITHASRKKAMLLHYVGEETCDVFETLTVPEPTDESDEYRTAVNAFADYFEPQKCVDHHVYIFRQESQKSGENITEFYTRLQLLARKCEFANTDLEIKRQIIQGTSSVRLRRKAIEQNLSLEGLLKAARSMETADERTSEIDKQQSHALGRHNNKTRDDREENSNGPPKIGYRNTKCGLCGGSYPHRGMCPAQGKKCMSCGKLNHFAKVCRSKSINRSKSSRTRKHLKGKHCARLVDSKGPSDGETLTSASAEGDSSEEYTFTTGAQEPQTAKPIFQVKIMDTPIRIMADSGATVNILSKKDFDGLKEKPQLLKTNVKVYPYMSSKPLNLYSKLRVNVTSDHRSSEETFYVAEGSSGSILSWMTSQKLNLIKAVNTVEQLHANLPSDVPEFLKDFPRLLNGMGEYKGEPVRIHIDESVRPVAQPHRRIPFHVRKQVEDKLRQLENEDIIERAEGPTPWVSPIVVVPKPSKPNEIRICVDMRSLNQAIIRERHVIPTIDDVVSDLNGCKVFSKIDLNQGYHQIPLHSDSRQFTTFSTHLGLFRYKRLNFGLSCAAEVFQKKVSDILNGIPCVKNISDDIYVGGTDKDTHDSHLKQVFHRLHENGLTINLPKCQFRVPTMLFFGHVFSEKGMSPDPKKVEALQNIAPPINASEVRSLLSSAAFCSRFIKDFALITRPLRQLTCDGTRWQWTQEEQLSFERLKEALSTKTTLGYFDPKKPTSIFVDGSPIGLGAVLTQEEESSKEVTPLHYASCPLTPTQARYPQIDREALSIYWAVKRFHLFVYGKEFKVITDHKPLVSLFNNPSSKPSARIERWLLELQQYCFTVEYRPGASSPADYASRHPVGDPESHSYDVESEEHISFVARNATPKAVTLSEIESATAEDSMLQAVMSAVRSGCWHKASPNISLSELSRYEQVKEQLTCRDTVLLKSDRLVIPATLQERIVDIAHEGHLGIVKTKALLREKVWFPCMDKMVETKVKACLPCQVVTPVYTREPLQMSVLPDNPFDQVSVDFAHVDGQTLLLVVDDYSRFPFVEPVSSTSASAVIPKLDQLFSTFGAPRVVKSDNGPPFNGEEFAKFACVLGFKHRKVTPLWPRANGEVERFVKTLKKCIKAAKVEGRNWRKELQAILRNYRTTPHATTGVAPAVLLLKRPVRNKLPQVNHIDPVAEIVRERDSSQKLKMKARADNKANVKPCNISLGEAVLVKSPFSESRGGTVYGPTPMTVVSKKGSMITAEGDNRTVTRNSSFFKNIYPPAVNQGNDESRNSGFGSSADEKCIQEPALTFESSNAPGPNSLDPPNTRHVKDDLPSSSNLVPVPVSQTQTSQSCDPPPLRRSSRRRIPRKILDL